MRSIWFYQTDIGEIGIVADDSVITNLTFGKNRIPQGVVEQETDLLKEAGAQLKDYLAERRVDFDLPLAPAGTEFRKTVWEALKAIPYGETRSYKTVAQVVGNEKSSRAVGNANNHNPIPIFIPCHRVIGVDGSLVGYLGGLEMKQHLLELEKRCASI